MNEVGVTPQTVVMQTEDPCYPWQTLTGDGRTLLILRQKIRVKEAIGRLIGVSREEFNWSLLARSEESRLYTGNLKFIVLFEEDKPETLNFAADEDEYVFHSMLAQPSMSLVSGENRVDVPSAFPSLILTEFDDGRQPDAVGVKKYHAEMPWQAWLHGRGKEKEPCLIKVHLAQVGLKTLLLEVVLQLETGEQGGLQKIGKNEMLMSLQDATMVEVLGLVVQRFFYESSCDSAGQNIILESVKKVGIVFVSENPGGERILAASHIMNEKNKIPQSPLPLIQPVRCFLTDQAVDYVQVAADKVFYKAAVSGVIDQICRISEEQEEDELPIEQSHRQPETAEVISSMQLLSPVGQVITLPPRPKPCEKWLKKEARPGIRPNSKTVLSIRL